MTQPTEPTATDNTETASESGPAAGEPATEPTESADEQETPNSEAAKYRVKLRETEAERDGLALRLAALQRRECESMAADVLEVPADLWDLGKANPADFYSDTDELDAGALRAAADALLAQRPGLRKQQRFTGTPNWGQHSGTMSGPAPSSWDQVVKGG